MATWQKCIVILGTIFFAYVGFDGTKDYGIFWQMIGVIVGGITGTICGFLLVAHIFGGTSEED